jgi:DNA-directed RNA polymerase subunit RPC12/RpoP
MGFKRTIENFVCEKCGADVIGNGYTNHCPKCLWGKHVDVEPGDRKEKCWGLMEPINIETKGGENILIHKCVKCGATRRQTASKNDSMSAILRLFV